MAIGAPDDVCERAEADVSAHGRKTLTTGALVTVLGAFAFAGQASAASDPAGKYRWAGVEARAANPDKGRMGPVEASAKSPQLKLKPTLARGRGA